MTIGPDYIARLLIEERIAQCDEAATRRLARSVAPDRGPSRWLRRAAASLRSRSRHSSAPATPVRVPS